MHAFRSLTGILRSSEEEQSRLTPREWECLRLTAQGCREEEVATIVGLASTTVRYHLDNVVRKLGASNRATPWRWRPNSVSSGRSAEVLRSFPSIGSRPPRKELLSMITLYHCKNARSLRALWALKELDLPFELVLTPFPPRSRYPG